MTPAFAKRAKACYQPRHTLGSALRQMANYSAAYGVLGVVGPPVAEPGGAASPEILAALALDLLAHSAVVGACARNLFCLQAGLDRSAEGSDASVGGTADIFLSCSWVAARSQIAGSITKKNRPNRQNFS